MAEERNVALPAGSDEPEATLMREEPDVRYLLFYVKLFTLKFVEL